MSINTNAAPAKGGERGAIENVWKTLQYTALPLVSSKDIAAAKVASSYGLCLTTSRLVCELAGIGGDE
jgi:hypothetical protein